MISSLSTPLARLPRAAVASEDVACELKASEAEWLASIRNRDTDRFVEMTAPQFFYLDGGGYVNRPQFVDVIQRLNIESLTTEQMQVFTIDANSSAVTYTIHQKESLDGFEFPPNMYATSVWTKQSGSWQMALHQESPIIEDEPPAKG